MARYGIGHETYMSMLAAQSGVCAICGEPPQDRRLAVDHDHETGKVRGLLHRKCNTAIALLGENSGICRKAAEYLERT